MSIIDYNIKEFDRYHRMLKSGVYITRRATAGLLTRLARGSRESMPSYMRSIMMIRDNRLLKSSFGHRPAKPISHPIAYMGSISKPRFSAWGEQERGDKTHRSAVSTLLARSGTKQRKMAAGARMGRGGSTPGPWDYPAGGEFRSVCRMLRTLDKRGYNKTFILPRRKGLVGGVYKFSRKRIASKHRGKMGKPLRRARLTQSFDNRLRQPRRRPWMGRGVRRYMTKTRLQHEYYKSMGHAIQRWL